MTNLSRRLAPGLCCVLLANVGGVLAQQPAPANPAAPTIAAPFPMGMQRGTTLDLQLTGANLADPVSVLASFTAKATIPTAENNGKDNAKLLVRLEVPHDAPIGWHVLRLATARGVSNSRLFCIDDLPQVTESADNHSPDKAQEVPIPSVVCGRVDPELSDYFRFQAHAGQRLSFELLGRRLGSGLDPQVVLLEGKTGKQLAYSDDAPGLLKDPRFTYLFKESGTYVLEVRDVRYQGGGDWYYRLRIGEFPTATTPVPLAMKRGTVARIAFAGPQVERAPAVTVMAPIDPLADTLWIWPTAPGIFPSQPRGVVGWPVPLLLSDMDEIAETEPNDDPAQPNRVNVPSGVSAQFLKKGDKDHFVFAAKKGQRIVIEFQTLELQSPTSIYAVLKNAKGAELAKVDPTKDAARIDFTAAEDGDCLLAVEHLHYWGGPEESYRFTVAPHEPRFTLSASVDRLDVPQGGVSVLLVQAARVDYAGPIELSLQGPGGIAASGTIPAGQNGAILAITAPESAPIAAGELRLVGKAVINGKEVTERLDVMANAVRDLGNLPFPPRNLRHDVAMGIAEKPPFTLEAKFDHPEGVRGLGVPVTVTATKAMGFDDEITVTSFGLPPAQGQPPIPPVTVKIPKGQTQARVEFKPPANAPLAAFPEAFVGRAKHQGRDVAIYAPPAELKLALPFDLQVQAPIALSPPGMVDPQIASMLTALDAAAAGPQPLLLGYFQGVIVPGLSGKKAVKVTAVRKGGYLGPITLEVRNLPANVTATKPTLAEKQTEAWIELTAAANAAIGPKTDVNVLGTATAAGNQQNASANFTVDVVKR